MKEEPDELLQRLSDESLSAGLTLEDWVEYLFTLKQEVDNMLRVAERDLENERNK